MVKLDLTDHNSLAHWQRMKPQSEAYIKQLAIRWETGQIKSWEYYCEKQASAIEQYRKIVTRIAILQAYTPA